MSPRLFVRKALAAIRSGEGLRGELLRGGIGSISVKVGATFIALGLALVLTRTLGVEQYGVYSVVRALVTVMAIPAQMGLPNLVVRETAGARVRGNWALIRGLWRWASLMAILISLALMFTASIGAWWFADRFSHGELITFYWSLVLVPLVALGNLRGAALRGLHRVVQGQLPEFILRPLFLLALVLIAHLAISTRAVSAADAMILHAMSSLVAFTVGAFLLLRARPAPLRIERKSERHPRLWLASALPLGMVEGMQLINQNVGVIGLGIVASAEDVGIFRVALQGGMLVSFGLTAINLIVGPHIARIYEQGDMLLLQKLVTVVTRVAFVMSLILAMFFVISGPIFLETLFGSAFAEAYVPLLIIAGGQTINAFTGCVGQILYMTKHETEVAKAVAVGAVCNVALVAILAPIWGYSGVAVAQATSVVIWNATLAFRVRQRTGLIAAAFWKGAGSR